MKPFWNDGCETFSEQLWKPSNSDLIKSKKDTPYWDCDNTHISFTHYLPKEKINTNIEFKPVPVLDNKIDKRQIFYGLFSTEITRLNTKIKKNKFKNSNLTKYLDDIKKIQLIAKEITNSTQKHRQFFLRIEKKFNLFREKNDIGDKCHPIVTQHFVQVDKIYTKMERLDDIIYCKKVKIMFSEKQQKIIMSWMHDTTEIYNDLAKEFNLIQDKILKKYEKTDKKIYYSKFLKAELKKKY